MRPLKYAINVTLDGCCDHQVGPAPDAESHLQLELVDPTALLEADVT